MSKNYRKCRKIEKYRHKRRGPVKLLMKFCQKTVKPVQKSLKTAKNVEEAKKR